MIFTDKICGSSLLRSQPSTLSNLEPFSTYHFIKNYNNILNTNELEKYYNIALLQKEKALPLHLDLILQTTANENHKRSLNPDNFLLSESKKFIPSISQSESESVITTTVSGTESSEHFNYPILSAISPALSVGPETPTSSINSFLNRRHRGEKRPIPEDQKDEKYFERRKRNNEAAKKSRDARKLREDRIAFRAAMLEQENAILRTQTIALREEVTTLRQMLCNRPTI